MTGLTTYNVIGTQRITLNLDDAAALEIPTGCSAATVSARGGIAMYSVDAEDLPTQQFGRPIPDGEEVVLINREWLGNFRIVRGEAATVYVYVTYYRG